MPPQIDVYMIAPAQRAFVRAHSSDVSFLSGSCVWVYEGAPLTAAVYSGSAHTTVNTNIFSPSSSPSMVGSPPSPSPATASLSPSSSSSSSSSSSLSSSASSATGQRGAGESGASPLSLSL